MPIILDGTTGITTPGITNTGTFVFQGPVQVPAGTVGAPSVTTTGDTNTGIFFPAADTIGFVEGGVEAMRLTSAGDVGIGTTSPACRLHVDGQEVRLNASSGPFYSLYSAGTRDFYLEASAGGINLIGTTSKAMVFGTNNAERARIDAVGNMGLGVTPTNNTLGKTIQNGQAAVWVSETGSNRFWLGSNWYNNGADRYINNGFANLYTQQNGKHIWLNAPSGTAGNTVSFTEAMTLDASGNLFLGTTSAIGAVDKMSISGGNLTVSRTSGIQTLIGDNTQASYVGSATNHALVFLTNAAERARITSGGNLLVGTTSDATVNATSARTNVNGNLNVTGYTQTSLFQTGLGVPDTGDPSGWCRLGRIDTTQGGAVVHIRVYFHTGFNASVAQTGMADILFKTSNGSSSTAGSTGPFYGDVVTYSYGYAGIGIIRVVQNNTSQYDFFLFLGSYTNGSIYTVDVTSPTTWTQFGNLQTPSGNYIDSGIRNVAYS